MIDFRPYRRRRTPAIGEHVCVYRNLNRPHGPWFSVRAYASGLVLGHCRAITLTECELEVSEAGRQRVLASGRKNVHAWIRGELAPDDVPAGAPWAELAYNPRRWSTFVDGAGRPVLRAEAVTISRAGVAFAG